MSALAKLKESSVWDHRHGLPLCPRHNNPHFYNAVSWRIVRENGEEVDLAMKEADFKFEMGCDGGQLEDRRLSWFYRWPDKTGGNFSHDEMIGRAYTSSTAAVKFLCDLIVADGVYPDENGKILESRDFSRFVFLVPYLRARARHSERGQRVTCGWKSQFVWALHVVRSAFIAKREKFDEDGALKIWVMGEEMQTLPLSWLAYRFWQWQMHRKGITPRLLFSERYLTEEPIFAEIAPARF